MQQSDILPIKVLDFASLSLTRHPAAVIRHKKLSQQKLQPYCVTSILSGGRALELEFPPNLKLHNIISIQEVEQSPNASKDPCHREYPRPSPVDETLGLYQARVIEKKALCSGKIKYKVHREGYPSEEDQWLGEEDVAQATIDECERRQAQRLSSAATYFLTLREFGNEVAECQMPLAGGEHREVIRFTEATPFQYEIRVKREAKTMERPVLYVCRNTREFERNYESTKRELASVVCAFCKLCHLLE